MDPQTQTLRSDRLSLDLCPAADNSRLDLTLTDRDGGKVWGPTPLLQLEVYQRSEQRTETYQRYRIDSVQAQDDRIHIVLTVTSRKIQIGLWLRLVDGELAVIFSPNEWYERWDAFARLFAVQVLPELCRIGPDGTLVLPLGEGATCRPRGKSAMRDRGLYYMEQSRWELGTLLPVLAGHDADGGLMMMHRQGATDGEWHVRITDDEQGVLGMGFSFRRHWIDPVDMGTREIRVCPIPGDADPVLVTAKRLRRHIIDDLGKKTLRERAQEAPDLAYIAEAMAFKPFHGIENEGLICANWDKTNPLSFKNCMTFDELGGHLDQLKAAGIDKVYNQLVGWNVRGHDGLYPTRFPIEERVGGEEGLQRLISKHRELGYLVTFHDNFMMNIPGAPDYDENCVAWDVYGQPLLSGWWSGGLENHGWPLAYPYERLEGYMRTVQERYGLDGPYYMDYMCRPLEVNYHPQHRGHRGDCARGQCLVMETANRVFGCSATEYGVLPIAVAADYISAAGQRVRGRGWAIEQLLEQVVPIWQLALSGLVMREANIRSLSWELTAMAAAYGRIPRDEYSTRGEPMPQISPQRVARLAAVYDVACRQTGHLRWEEMTNFERLSDTAYRTSFSDGSSVIVDEADGLLGLNGKPIPCPAALRDPMA